MNENERELSRNLKLGKGKGDNVRGGICASVSEVVRPHMKESGYCNL